MDNKSEKQTGKAPQLREIRLTGLYLRNIGASIVGLFAVTLLNLFTPTNLLELHQNFILREGGWMILIIIEPLIMATLILFQYRIQRPITEIIKKDTKLESIPQSVLKKVRRRILNLPFIFWLFNLILWTFLSVVIALLLGVLLDAPAKLTLILIFRTIMVGLIAANLSFFLVEDHSRDILIPVFFPKGRLYEVPGSLRISIVRRIRILYMAGTSVPMIILLGTFFFTLWDLGDHPIDAVLLSREILIFSFVLCAIFVVISLRLNFLVGRSILEPIKSILKIIKKIREGDFNQKIRVISSDEIGILGDAGNLMIEGLAERERIRETFGKYVTPEIRDQILQGKIPLDGERVVATLLFSDLRGFTSFVESNVPEEVIQSMRAYFTAMQKAVRAHGGLVLQYVGDEVESVFGVPIPYEGHEDKAVRAALEMRKALEVLNRERAAKGKSVFRHGIGIHTGEVLAGNTGSEDRLSYALIGDTVNLASRIQDLTKVFDCDILVSEATVKGLGDEFPLEKQIPQTVRGISKPVTVYKVL